MNPEEVLIKFVVDNSQALEAAKAVEDSIASIQTAIDKMHERWLEQGKKVQKDVLDSMSENMEKLQEVSEEHFNAMGKGFNQAYPQLEKINESIQDGSWKTGLYTAVFEKLGDLAIDAYKSMTEGVNALISNLGYLHLSAASSAEEMDRMTFSILQAANETGLAFDNIAVKARTLYDYSGLKEGLGEVIVAAESMNRVFGMSGEEFSRFAATTIRLSDGILDGKTLMEEFDEVVGITGFRMEAMLQNLESMSKQMAKITGGSAQFAKSMQALTGHVAKVSSLLQQTGGDAEAFQEIVGQILDPNQWDQVVQTLGPGIAGSLNQMQQALMAGDMDSFQQMLADGAKSSAQMAQGMNGLVRAATGFDFRQIETLSNLDPTGMERMAAATGKQASVADRSAALMKTFTEGMDRMWNNLVSILMRLAMPAMEAIAAAVASMNDSLSRNQDAMGGVIDSIGKFLGMIGWGIGLIFRLVGAIADLTGSTTVTFIIIGVAFLALLRLMMKGVTKFVSWVSKPITELGEAIGKGIGQGFQEASVGVAKGLDTIGKSSDSGMKGALVLLMVGAAFFFLGAAIALVASQPIGGVIVAVIALVAILLVIAAMAPYLATAAGTLMLVGIAFMMLGMAAIFVGVALLLVATALTIMAQLPLFTLALGMMAVGYALIFLAVGLIAFSMAVGPFLMAMTAIALFTPILLVAIAVLYLFGGALNFIAMAAPGLIMAAIGIAMMGPVLAIAAFGMMMFAAASWPFVMALGLLSFFLAPLIVLAAVVTVLAYAFKMMAQALFIGAQAVYLMVEALWGMVGLPAMTIAWNSIWLAMAIRNLSSALGDGSDEMLKGAKAIYIVMTALNSMRGIDLYIAIDVDQLRGFINSIERLSDMDIDVENVATGIQTMNMLVDMLTSMADKVDDLIYIADRLGSSGADLNKIYDAFFSESGLLTKSVLMISNALTEDGIFWDSAIDITDQLKSINGVLDVLGRITKVYGDLAIMGGVMSTTVGGKANKIGNDIYWGVMSFIWMLSDVVWAIYIGFSTEGVMWGRNAVEIGGQLKTIDSVLDLLSKITNVYGDLAIMGAVLGAKTNDDSWSSVIKRGIVGDDGNGGMIGMLSELITTIRDKVSTAGVLWGRNVIDISGQLDTIKGVLDIIDRISKSYGALAIMGAVLNTNASGDEKWSAIMVSAADGLFGKNGAITTLIKTINQNLSAGGWFSSGDTINSAIGTTVDTALSIVDRIEGTYGTLAVLGSVMAADNGKFQQAAINASEGLFGKNGAITLLIKRLKDNLSRYRPQDLESISTGINAINGTMKGISDTFGTLAVLGSVMSAQAGDGASWLSKAQTGVEGLFSREGVITKMMAYIRQASAGMRLDPAVVESMNAVFDVVNRATDLMAKLATAPTGTGVNPLSAIAGTVASVNETMTPEALVTFGTNLNAYADIIEAVNTRFQAMDTTPMADVAMAVSDVQANMSQDVSIAAEGAADLAVQELEQARRQHEQNVEALLTEIRDGIRGLGGSTGENRTSPTVQAPRMSFAGLFGSDEGVF